MSLDVGSDGKTGFFAVFDGHGGKEVAKFAALKMVRGCGLQPTHLRTQLQHAHPLRQRVHAAWAAAVLQSLGRARGRVHVGKRFAT